MGFIKSLLFNMIDPFGILRNFILKPIMATSSIAFGFLNNNNNNNTENSSQQQNQHHRRTTTTTASATPDSSRYFYQQNDLSNQSDDGGGSSSRGGISNVVPTTTATTNQKDTSTNTNSVTRTTTTSSNSIAARNLAVKATFLAFATATIIWTSIFMYIAFYYTYMPAIEHVRPVYIQFDVCNYYTEPHVDCVYPHAFVQLTKNKNLLMVGQPYKLSIGIEMPETLVNQELGMFMVCADLRDEYTKLINHSCRSAMMPYKSTLIRTIKTWILSPLYVFGIKEEKQQVLVELFTHFQEESIRPIRDVYIEIQSRKIQFYNVNLHIVAHFTGLRYIMFHWPLLSASIGICTNLFFIMLVSLLSWYHWGNSVWLEQNVKERFQFGGGGGASDGNDCGGGGGVTSSTTEPKKYGAKNDGDNSSDKKDFSPTSVDYSNQLLDDDSPISFRDDDDDEMSSIAASDHIRNKNRNISSSMFYQSRNEEQIPKQETKDENIPNFDDDIEEISAEIMRLRES